MKSYLHTAFLSIIIIQQSFSQLKEPSYNFIGTEMEWLHAVKDTNSSHKNLGIIWSDEQGEIWTTPVEFENKIIYSYHNNDVDAYGTLISCIDSKSGAICWQKNYTPYTQNGYGYTYFHIPVKANDGSLEFNGIRSIFNNMPNNGSSNNPFFGYFTRLNLDLNTGNVVNYYCNEEYTPYYSIGNFQKVTGQSSECFYGLGLDQSNTYILFPQYLDVINDTLINGESEVNKHVKFYTAESSGLTNPVFYYGPYTRDHKTFSYYACHQVEGQVWKHFFWKVSGDGSIITFNEITDLMNGPDNMTFGREAKQDGDHIILTLRYKDGTPMGHRGYAVLDLDGNILKKIEKLVIDNMKVGYIVTTKIKESDDLLHVIRFQENNNVFLYKESPDHQFVKCGELINPNPKLYAYIPNYAIQTSDRGIVIAGYYVVDSISSKIVRFEEGGWQSIFKISAQALGLPTSISDNSNNIDLFSLYPNPSSNYLNVKSDMDFDEIKIYSPFGLLIEVQNKKDRIDITNLSNGIYFCELRKKGSALGIKKFVKCE